MNSESAMSEDNHVSVMTIISGSSADIRTSSCVNLFLIHCALKLYIIEVKIYCSHFTFVIVDTHPY